MTVAGDKATEIGDYNAVFSIISTANCNWSDSTIEDKSVAWSVGKMRVRIPSCR